MFIQLDDNPNPNPKIRTKYNWNKGRLKQFPNIGPMLMHYTYGEVSKQGGYPV